MLFVKNDSFTFIYLLTNCNGTIKHGFKMMIKEKILITGADGGIGLALIKNYLGFGVGKIYATGLNLERLQEIQKLAPNVIGPIKLDITSNDDVMNCAEIANDVTLLINNAGIELKKSFVDENNEAFARKEMEVNYFGMIKMINAFIPVIRKSPEGKIVNVLSLASLAIVNRIATYCATKFACHAMTESLRESLKNEDILVCGVYMGYVDTKMVPEKIIYEKAEPLEVARNIIESIEKKIVHIYPDKMAREFSRENKIRTKFYE